MIHYSSLYTFDNWELNKSIMENKAKHLEMIQNVIERMGSNSFQLKGWAVTLVSIIGALSSRETDRRFFLLTFIPLIAFWGIDSFYLQLERKYKELYKQVRNKKESEIDFDMDTSSITTKGTKIGYWRCAFSNTEFYFYGSILLAVIVLAFMIKVL